MYSLVEGYTKLDIQQVMSWNSHSSVFIVLKLEKQSGNTINYKREFTVFVPDAAKLGFEIAVSVDYSARSTTWLHYSKNNQHPRKLKGVGLLKYLELHEVGAVLRHIDCQPNKMH